MKLSGFLNRLFSDGMVSVPGTMTHFQNEDLQNSLGLIRKFHQADSLEMPCQAPAFEPDAALWAAQYFFHATQLVLLRALEEQVMDEYLTPYPGEISAGAVYSVDLIFRHLGPLFKLSSGISPDDPLVRRLSETAAQWPFSSVGLNIDASGATSIIFSHASLKYAYIDRIIEGADVKRLRGAQERAALKEVMGMHQGQLWPALELLAIPDEITV